MNEKQQYWKREKEKKRIEMEEIMNTHEVGPKKGESKRYESK